MDKEEFIDFMERMVKKEKDVEMIDMKMDTVLSLLELCLKYKIDEKDMVKKFITLYNEMYEKKELENK